jgi:soluble lytic murein transglycosylase
MNFFKKPGLVRPLALFILGGTILPSGVLGSSASLPNQAYARATWKQARELLGNSYPKSVVKQMVEGTVSDAFVFETTERLLKSPWKKQARNVAQTILQESRKYSFDPVFLMAVIRNESNFRPEAKGKFGEIGLMQITPDTATWISKKFHLSFKGPKSLKDPVNNIILGSAYLAYLRNKYANHCNLYLAAYNMGSRKLKHTLAKQIYPKIYPTRVIHHYLALYTQMKNEQRVVGRYTAGMGS